MRPRARALLAALALTLAASCGQRPAGVDLIILNGAEPQSLDPAVISGQIEGRLCTALFEGLTRRNAAGGLIPGAAERWEVSADGLTYTFHLRPSARWSNGDPVTAHDFAASWRRVLEPATAAVYAEILFFIRNAEAYQTGKITDFSRVGIRAVDDLTLRVELAAPAAYFPDVVAFTTYLPVHRPTVERHGDRWTRPGRMVSNGAYQLRAWKINDRVELEANPHYWNASAVRSRRIDALAVTKATTALNLYLTGQADVLLDKSLIPPLLAGELRDRPDLHRFTFLATYFYRFNTTRKPFDDPRVRRALAAAIDREGIVRRITRGGEPPAPAFTPPGIPGYIPPPGTGHDPELARRLLAEAGFPGGRGFPRASILYNKTELNEQIAVEIQGMWRRELGIEVELHNQEWATYLKTLDNLQYDIARSSWVGDYNDPNTFLDCFVSGRGNNRTGWSHPRYDALLAEANRTADPTRRMALLREAETILISQEHPIAPIYHNVGMMLFDPKRITGLQGNVLDEHPFQEIERK
jgi:oligopeptide transport system substrate-binding protein